MERRAGDKMEEKNKRHGQEMEKKSKRSPDEANRRSNCCDRINASSATSPLKLLPLSNRIKDSAQTSSVAGKKRFAESGT